jgi:hypothetical protein
VKALTVRQPWASLIAAGIKDVENRSWRTSYRGPLLIHAGLGVDVDDLLVWREYLPEPLPKGSVVARVELIDCVRDSTSTWALPGRWHWLLANPEPIRAGAPVRGQLGLWDLH